jgi:hypothetical protein
MPDSEKWEIEILWKILDDARRHPEGMDIEKLQNDALSILKDVAKKYLAAAGGGEDTCFSLMMKKMMALVDEGEKRAARGAWRERIVQRC